MIRRFKFKLPFLEDDSIKKEPAKNDSKDAMNLQQLEEALVREQLIIDHESYRKQHWEPLKHFRSKYDSEYPLSETILTSSELNNKKKEMDKHTLNAIRLSIIADDHERVFAYMDLLNFA